MASDLRERIEKAIVLPEGITLFDLEINGTDSVLFFLKTPCGRDTVALELVGTSRFDLKQLADHLTKLLKSKYQEA